MSSIEILLVRSVREVAADSMRNRGLLRDDEVWMGPKFDTGANALAISDHYVQVTHWDKQVAKDSGLPPSVTYFYPHRDISRIKVAHDAPLRVVK